MTVVIYCSRTGSTKKYAETFAKNMGYECFSVYDKNIPDDQFIYFGWLNGPRVSGFNNVDRSKLLAVGAVSLSKIPSFGWNKVKDQNKITVPIYPLLGWIDRSKLNIGQKIFFVFLCAFMKMRGLDDVTGPQFDAMMNGGSFYDESGLEDIYTFCRSR